MCFFYFISFILSNQIRRDAIKKQKSKELLLKSKKENESNPNVENFEIIEEEKEKIIPFVSGLPDIAGKLYNSNLHFYIFTFFSYGISLIFFFFPQLCNFFSFFIFFFIYFYIFRIVSSPSIFIFPS